MGDFIHGVIRGKAVTLKHFLIGLGLHNIPGLKTLIKILSHLGHSIDYNLLCEVETAEAEAAQKWMSESQSLQQNQESVLTYWWFDNFNQNVDSHSGKGAIDSTHIVEFSERNDVNFVSSAAANVPCSRRRSLAPSGIDLPTVKVDKKRSPVLFHKN